MPQGINFYTTVVSRLLCVIIKIVASKWNMQYKIINSKNRENIKKNYKIFRRLTRICFNSCWKYIRKRKT